MTTHKHTAGPYSISGIAGDNHVMAKPRRDRHGAKVTVAIVPGWAGIDPEEHEANKQLFAAAPALLAALEDAAFVLGECSVGADKLSDLFPVKLAKIRAAIALATGSGVQS